LQQVEEPRFTKIFTLQRGIASQIRLAMHLCNADKGTPQASPAPHFSWKSCSKEVKRHHPLQILNSQEPVWGMQELMPEVELHSLPETS